MVDEVPLLEAKAMFSTDAALELSHPVVDKRFYQVRDVLAVF